MTSLIAAYSNQYFYEGKLKTLTVESPNSIYFYDTAGADFTETFIDESFSILNEEELNFITDRESIACLKHFFNQDQNMELKALCG